MAVRPLVSGASELSAFLASNNIPQHEAARVLGVSHVTISQWIAGFNRPVSHWRDMIERWTEGQVPSRAWLTEQEASKIARIRPFRPKAEGAAPPRRRTTKAAANG